MKIIAEISIAPLTGSQGNKSVSEYIAACERIFKNTKGLNVQLHATGTNIEGEFDQVINALKACIEAVHKNGAERLETTLKISSRSDDKMKSMHDFVTKVEALA